MKIENYKPTSDSEVNVEMQAMQKLNTRELTDRLERYIDETSGECGECGEKYIRVNGSDCTCNSNKTRYRKPNDFSAWNIFRCDCGAVITDSFISA